MAFCNMKSASEHNVYITYVCTDVVPNSAFNKFGEGRSEEYDHAIEDDDDSDSIKVEKSQALYDLVEVEKNNQTIYTLDYAEANKNVLNENIMRGETSNDEKNENIESFGYKNPNILRLTKMKWLTEHQSITDSSSGSTSLTTLSSSSSLEDSKPSCINDKYLTTILNLDKEHNLFGLARIAADLQETSINKTKKPDKPAFPQTAIVQVACCVSKCCKHQTNSDYPISLKCGSCCTPDCNTCCVEPSCKPCCRNFFGCNSCSPFSCCKPPCRDKPGKCCKSPKCRTDNCGAYGLTIAVNRRPKYKPEPILITPKNSCILSKPMSARTCTHCPPCRPPSSCFPYLMPCYWPARPSAPCTASKCFHNPKCPPPRCPKLPDTYLCPKHKKCTTDNMPCKNSSCAMYGKCPKQVGKTAEKAEQKKKK